MPRLKTLIILFITISIASCSKSDKTNGGNNNIPDAKAIHDNSNYGVYKGVFIGSSGNIFLNINNDGALSATLNINGTSSKYTSTQSITANQPTLVTFTNGLNSFQFSCLGNGTNAAISNISISGHNYAGMSILKEKSDSIVKVYEGTFKTDVTGPSGATGVINWELKGSQISGLIVEDGASWSPYATFGTINGTSINGSCPNDPIVIPGQCSYAGTAIIGSMSSDGQTMTGTFSNCYGTGTWKAIRK